MSIRNELLEQILAATPSSGTTYGPLSNVAILAIVSPSDEETVFSNDDFFTYVFFNVSWYSPAGVVLV